MRHRQAPPPEPWTPQEVRNPARAKSPRGRSPSGRMSRLPCKEHLKGTCTNPSCQKWHSPKCLFYKTKEGCKFGEKVFLCTPPGWWTALQKVPKEWWQKCCGFFEGMHGNWVAYFKLHDAAEVFIDLTEVHRHAEANPTCEIHKGYCTSRQNSRPKTIAWNNLPRWSSSAQPQRSKNLRIVHKKRQSGKSKPCPRSSVWSWPNTSWS